MWMCDVAQRGLKTQSSFGAFKQVKKTLIESFRCCCCLKIRSSSNVLVFTNKSKCDAKEWHFGWSRVQSSREAEKTWDWSQNRESRMKLVLWEHISNVGNEEQQEPDGVGPEKVWQRVNRWGGLSFVLHRQLDCLIGSRWVMKADWQDGPSGHNRHWSGVFIQGLHPAECALEGWLPQNNAQSRQHSKCAQFFADLHTPVSQNALYFIIQRQIRETKMTRFSKM